jgi:hypothetical protein
MLTLLMAAITAVIYIEGTGYLGKLYIFGELFDWRTSKWIIFLVLVLAGILPAAAAASSPLPLLFIPVGIIFLRRMKSRLISGQTKAFLLLEALFAAFMFSSNISGLLDGGIDILSGFSWNDILTAASAGWDYNAAYTYLHGGNASETAAAMSSWDFVPAVRLVFIRLVVLALAVIACAAVIIYKFFLMACRHAFLEWSGEERERAASNMKLMHMISDGEQTAENEKTFQTYIQELGLSSVFDVSSAVQSAAEKNPVNYILKYTKMEERDDHMEKLDCCIDFRERVEEYQASITAVGDDIRQRLPWMARFFVRKKTSAELAAAVHQIWDGACRMPSVIFAYESGAGRTQRRFHFLVDKNGLVSIRDELCRRQKKNVFTKAQRSAMTSDLRDAILRRDNWTCQICGNSVFKEPNLLLEVDHIIPVARGGKTEPNNLQTLCWKCNRNKGAS